MQPNIKQASKNGLCERLNIVIFILEQFHQKMTK